MVANLAPRKRKFGVSEGLVRAASHADEKANPGIFVLEPEIFDFIPDGRPVDFSGQSHAFLREVGVDPCGAYPLAHLPASLEDPVGRGRG